MAPGPIEAETLAEQVMRTKRERRWVAAITYRNGNNRRYYSRPAQCNAFYTAMLGGIELIVTWHQETARATDERSILSEWVLHLLFEFEHGSACEIALWPNKGILLM